LDKSQVDFSFRVFSWLSQSTNEKDIIAADAALDNRFLFGFNALVGICRNRFSPRGTSAWGFFILLIGVFTDMMRSAIRIAD